MTPPRIKLCITPEKVVAELKLAGAKPRDLGVFLEGSMLTIEGFLPFAEMACGEGSQYCYQRDRRREKFVSTVQIPVPIVADEANAFYFSGLVRVTLPRPPAQRSLKAAGRVSKKRSELRR